MMNLLLPLLVVSLLAFPIYATKHESHGLIRKRDLVEALSNNSSENEGENKETKDTNDAELLDDEHAIVQRLAAKLAPKYLSINNSSDDSADSLQKHQFLHLHHMKTGGTSMDGLLNCAMRRWKQIHNTPSSEASSSAQTMNSRASIAYMNLHECGLTHYRQCRDGHDMNCQNRVRDASILSYCAPLMDLPTFGWNTTTAVTTNTRSSSTDSSSEDEATHAVTVLRHPVHRVWSMYRFQTKSCYKCQNLTDVYQAMDGNNASSTNAITPPDEICGTQLSNHQTRNLVSIEWDESHPDVMVENAIYNLQHFFTFVGITEQMEATAEMVGQIFPFLNVSYGDSSIECPMPHKNSSPRNNRCGKKSTHWELPDEPDQETENVIIQHNDMDLKVYEAALQLFEYQRMALAVDQDME